MIKTLHVDSSSGKGGSVRSLAGLLLSNIPNPLFQPRVILGNSSPVLKQLEDHGLGVQLAENPPEAPGRLQNWLIKKSPAPMQVACYSRIHRRWFQELDRLFRKDKELLLHANISPIQDYGALQAAHENGIPAVCHLRSWPSKQLRSALPRMVPSDCRFVAVSEAVRQAWILAGLPPASIEVVFNGHESGPGPRTELDSILPAHLHSKPAVCCIARFVSWKNHEFLLNAWSRYRKQLPETTLLLLGDGPLESRMKKLVQTLHLENSVVFLGHRNDALPILRACQALVLPSLREPMARVVLEAYGAGVPVVAVNSGGTPEMVKDGVTGLLADEKDGEQLIRSIGTILKDRSLAERLNQVSGELLRNQFSPERHHQRISEIYRKTFTLKN